MSITTIKGCVCLLEKGFSNADEISSCHRKMIIEDDYLAYKGLGIIDIYVGGDAEGSQGFSLRIMQCSR